MAACFRLKVAAEWPVRQVYQPSAARGDGSKVNLSIYAMRPYLSVLSYFLRQRRCRTVKKGGRQAAGKTQETT